MSFSSYKVEVDSPNARQLYQGPATSYPTGAVADGSNANLNSKRMVGQYFTDPNYLRSRLFINFNLETLAKENENAAEVLLHYYIASLNNATAFTFEVRPSTAAVPAALDDWPDYGDVLDSVADPAVEWHTFAIPAANLAAVTKFVLTTNREIAGTKPTTKENLYVDGPAPNRMYLTYKIISLSKAPTNLGVTPSSDGIHVVTSFTYHAAGTTGNTKCTYRRIQISDDAGFTNILKDTKQEAVSPAIADGGTLTDILEWFPTSAGTYYLRAATWDDDNKDFAEVWGSTSFVVAYPVETSLSYTQDKEKFTFTAVVQDNYSKPPRTTLTVGNKSFVMDITERINWYNVVCNGDQVTVGGDNVIISISDQFYEYSKTIELEEGDLEYHIEVGNVWTVKICNTYFLHASYKLDDKKLEIFWGDKKINAWNITLEENLLPDLNEVEFDTDENITTGDLKLVTRIHTLKSYPLQIEDRTYMEDHYHISTIETAKQDMEQAISVSTKSANSKTFLESILQDYNFIGTLSQNITLQQFVDEKLSFIFDKILILNGAYAFLRNKTIYLHNLTETSKLTLFKADKGVSWADSRKSILNHLKEYYKIVQYPVPSSLLTNYDSANWGGTVSDEVETNNHVLPINDYLLKGTGTISRVVDFLLSDFDSFKMNWIPATATTVPIRLETDASNYYTYTRTFSGKKSAGFNLSGTSQDDEITKTLNFAAKYISKIEGYTTAPCKVKYTLKKSGATVAETVYQNVSSYFGQVFPNVQCDQIILTFSNLYIVGASYGVSCSQLKIEEYKNKYNTTGSTSFPSWQQNFTGYGQQTSPATSPTHFSLTVGSSITFIGEATLGAVPALSTTYNERYGWYGTATILIKTWENGAWVNSYVACGKTFEVVNGILKAHFQKTFNGPLEAYVYGTFAYNVIAQKIRTTPVGEEVWFHANYAWSETYNLWDYISIPLSSFAKVGSPTNQINTIRLLPANVNYFENIYVNASNPIPQFIEVKDQDSIDDYGDKFEPRKNDGWSSEESATAFANALINLLKDPIMIYSKTLPINTRINCGDMVKADGVNLPVKRIYYDFENQVKTIFVGKAIENTIEFLRNVARRIETLEKNII